MSYLPNARYQRRRKTELVVVHHTQSETHATLKQIRGWHLKRGWIDIGYNYLIRQGKVIQGRPDWAIGSHAAGTLNRRRVGWNSKSIGVALVGDYREGYPPPAQMRAFFRLLVDILEKYPDVRILGHKDAMAEVGLPGHTDCPGSDWLNPILESLAMAGLYGK